MRIYFFGVHFDPANIPHGYAVLAEGLNSLGHTCLGNTNKMKPSIDSDYIIHASGSTKDADVILIDSTFCLFTDLGDTIGKLSKENASTPIVMIDESDGLRTPGFGKKARECALVLKTHYNRKMKYPGNFVPWQFGIANRMIDAIKPLPLTDRQSAISVNFRAKHQLRDHMNKLVLPIVEKHLKLDTRTDENKPDNFSPNDRFLFYQANGRHNPFYYQRLPQSLFVAAYGGVFCLPFGNHDKYTAKICRMINHAIPLFKYDRVRQWDSWRFWESMLAGCIALHVDLEKFGCELPVMPVNYQHYAGIDPYHPELFRDWFETAMEEWKQGKPGMLEKISVQARAFTLENYASPVVAERFLKLIEAL